MTRLAILPVLAGTLALAACSASQPRSETAVATKTVTAADADAFIADTIALDKARAVAAIRRMRERFKRPEMTPEELLLVMEAAGLIETVNILTPHVRSL